MSERVTSGEQWNDTIYNRELMPKTISEIHHLDVDLDKYSDLTDEDLRLVVFEEYGIDLDMVDAFMWYAASSNHKPNLFDPVTLATALHENGVDVNSEDWSGLSHIEIFRLILSRHPEQADIVRNVWKSIRIKGVVE